MKKIFLLVVFASAMIVANAQENMMSKRGTPILPEAGDWSIGISANPFIDWAFDKTRIMSANVPPSSANTAVRSEMPATLVGLYVKDATTAYRGMVRIAFGSNTVTQGSVADSINTPTEVKTGTMSIQLGAGIQKTRGKGRLHGIYGAMANIGFGGAVDVTNTYSKVLDVDAAQSRTLENKTGSGFNIGVNGFIGVEYFVLPKMSVSAEYGWGISLSSTGAGTVTTESTIGDGSAASTKSVDGAKSSSFNVGVSDIGGGDIVFHFYF